MGGALDAAQIAALQRKLVARADEIDALSDTADAAAATVELDQTRIGRLSRMDALQAQALAQEMRARQRLERQRIASALQRIEADEFGDCTACGEPIAPARLEADPTHTLCIGCAAAAERH